jgi:hypothetical protein
LFAHPYSFCAVPRASGPVFKFCALGLILGGTEGVGTRFHVLRSPTHFRRNRGRPVPFTCFALPDPFWAVSWASGPIFFLCAPGPVSGGTEGVGSRFHVLLSRAHFGLYRGRQVQFPCFALSDSYSTEPWTPGPVFMFCAPGIVFGGIEGIGSCFHLLCSLTLFRRYRGRRVPFSCFALPDSFCDGD